MYSFGLRLAIGMLLWRVGKSANVQLELERRFGEDALKQLRPCDLYGLQLEWRQVQPHPHEKQYISRVG
jgi:hypothetical protein